MERQLARILAELRFAGDFEIILYGLLLDVPEGALPWDRSGWDLRDYYLTAAVTWGYLTTR